MAEKTEPPEPSLFAAPVLADQERMVDVAVKVGDEELREARVEEHALSENDFR